jgi:2-polyprenyl-3-methyl-5-hydroxy-6-metoxy-1,4-benzoquinol methylase
MSLLQSFRAWFHRKILRDRAALWNHQYSRGRWEFLKLPLEIARFDACVYLLRRHAHAGSWLEIGCGEALLQRRLAPNDYQRFVGVDLSSVAIARAQPFAGHRVRYFVADMQQLQLNERFDAVIFAESISYVPHPGQLLRAYARFLNPAGVFIVSLFRNQRTADVWTEIHAATATIDQVTTTNAVGTWDCEVLRLR